MNGNAARLLLGLAAIAALVVLFVVLQGGDGGGPSPRDRSFEFDVAKGRVAGGEQDIEVNKGDRVTLTLSADVPAELHVHGYELEKRVSAGGSGSVTFTADLDGEYEVEAHSLTHGEEGPEVGLATLSVNP